MPADNALCFAVSRQASKAYAPADNAFWPAYAYALLACRLCQLYSNYYCTVAIDTVRLLVQTTILGASLEGLSINIHQIYLLGLLPMAKACKTSYSCFVP